MHRNLQEVLKTKREKMKLSNIEKVLKMYNYAVLNVMHVHLRLTRNNELFSSSSNQRRNERFMETALGGN